jgi:hypothetical protein
LFEDGTCQKTIPFPNSLTPVSASVLSYSGGYWSDALTINNNRVYDLSVWDDTFESVGDPFVIPIPSTALSQNMDIELSLREGSSDLTVACSPQDSLHFTASVQSVFSSSRVFPFASGCHWEFNLEDGSPQTISIPHDYSGSDVCVFAQASTDTWNASNVLHRLAFDFLSAYDLNNDYDLEINPVDFGLETDTSITSEIPYMWGPAVLEVSVWQ